MFCEQCGSEISADDKFCPNCGTPVQAENEMQENTFSQHFMNEQSFLPYHDMNAMTEKFGQSAKKAGKIAQEGLKSGQRFAAKIMEGIKPKLSKKVVGVTSVILVVLMSVLILFSNRKHTINLDDYVEVTFEGYQENGKAEVSVDREAVLLDIYKNAKIKGLKGKERKQLKNAEIWSDISMLIYNSDFMKLEEIYDEKGPKYKLNQSDGLSNGDEVIVSVDYDNTLFKKYGIKFKGSQKSFKVTGLEKAEEYDYFSNIDVIFSGTSPNAEVEITRDENNDDINMYVEREFSKTSGIKKGETITLNLLVDPNALLEECGYVLKETTKEFTCSNVAEYISALSQIPEDTMEKMKSQVEDVFMANEVAKWNNPKSLKKLNFAGCYLLKPKEGINADKYNCLYLIYTVTVKNDDGKFTYYYYYEFDDVSLMEDGTCSVDLNQYSTPGKSFYNESYYYGYESLESLVNDCITSRIDQYEFESTVTQ